ncbi:MAG TPA: 4a-hydroxytetrahydrobiopterin dehydratase [Candidatus Saccharimonadales bacterium]|nr:4a-hydroxytetrahydrobiopterin dehydratase [Candidatus Saccharimonadales bacterium]
MDTILSDDAIEHRLSRLNVAWTAIGNDYLVRSFQTTDFNAGVALINQIADIANECNHHPDLSLTYTQVEVRISTHTVAGITEADFALAAEIDARLG